ncbi:Alpha/Beta hydrolase protein [Hyaloraphidium curvatum]|nr:Alpha/Beta hydrolase protein [Hyaloraphidium curvatum]
MAGPTPRTRQSLLLLLLPLVVVALLTPPAAAQVLTKPRKGDAVPTLALLREARDAAVFATLAYHHSDKYDKCSPAGARDTEPACDGVDFGGLEEVVWITPPAAEEGDEATYHAVAFYAPETFSGPRIVVAFKGTDNFRMWWEATKSSMVAAPRICAVCHVFDSYHRAAVDMWPEVKRTLVRLARKYPKAGVTVTGHSAGAAMATYTSAFIGLSRTTRQLVDFSSFRLFAFASPRPGDDAFAEAFRDLPVAANSWPVFGCADAVPNFPPYADGFRHVGAFDEKGGPRQLLLLCPHNPFAQSGKVKIVQHAVVSCGLPYPWTAKGTDSCVRTYTGSAAELVSAAGIRKVLVFHGTTPYLIALGHPVPKAAYDKVAAAYADHLKWKLPPTSWLGKLVAKIKGEGRKGTAKNGMLDLNYVGPE